MDGRPFGESQAVWLTLDASGAETVVAVVRGGVVLRELRDGGAEGRPARLAAMVAGLLPDGVSAIAVVVGPGSFTGLRAAIALARGLADAGGLPVAGVTTGESLFCAVSGVVAVATAIAPGRFLVERGFPNSAFELADAIPGDAISDLINEPTGVAMAAGRRLSGAWPPRQLLPVYATPPAVTMPRNHPMR